MQPDVDLKKVRRRVTRYYYQHGMWDICMGIVMLGWGFIIHYDFLTITGVFILVGVLLVLAFIVWQLQRHFIPPRVGYMKYTENRRYARIATVLGTIFGLGMLTVFVYYIVTLPAGYYAGWRVWWRDYALLSLGIIGALDHMTLAYQWKAPRWYFNAVLIFAAFATYTWLDNTLGFWITGGIMLLVGLVLFVRFLREYPVPAEEGINVSQ